MKASLERIVKSLKKRRPALDAVTGIIFPPYLGARVGAMLAGRVYDNLSFKTLIGVAGSGLIVGVQTLFSAENIEEKTIYDGKNALIQKDISLFDGVSGFATPWWLIYKANFGNTEIIMYESWGKCVYPARDVEVNNADGRKTVQIRPDGFPIKSVLPRDGYKESRDIGNLAWADRECRATLNQEFSEPFNPYLKLPEHDEPFMFLSRNVEFDVPASKIRFNDPNFGIDYGNFTLSFCVTNDFRTWFNGGYTRVSTDELATDGAIAFLKENQGYSAVNVKGYVGKSANGVTCIVPHTVKYKGETFNLITQTK